MLVSRWLHDIPRRGLVAGALLIVVLAGYGGYRLLPRISAALAPTCAMATAGPTGGATTAGPPAPSASSAPPSASSAPPAAMPTSPAGPASTTAPATGTPPPIPTLPPGPPAGAAPLRVPVLIYHEVLPGADPAAADYQMTPALMESHLCTMKARGWQSITAHQLAELLAAGTPPPQRTFVITLDDGTLDHLVEAYPIIRRNGFVATFFVISERVGSSGYLSWDQVRALRDGGMEIGSHSANHPRMSDIPPAQSVQEVATAQRTLGLQLGNQPVTFAYPGGAYNDAAVEAVRVAGVMAAFTTAEGRAASWAERLTIPRINVGAQWSAEQLLSIMEGYVR